jgi:hypothetical protein
MKLILMTTFLIAILFAVSSQLAQADPIVLDPNFKVELYATVPGGAEGLAYNSGGYFEKGLYATAGDGNIYHITDSKTSSVFYSGLPKVTDNYRYEPAFDPSGAFGSKLYVSLVANDPYVQNIPGDTIIAFNPLGEKSIFFSAGSHNLGSYASTIAFGPSGSSFAPGLYLTDYLDDKLHCFDSSANLSTLGNIPLTDYYDDFIDMEFSKGGNFGTYAFVADAAARKIFRVDSTGASTKIAVQVESTFTNYFLIGHPFQDAVHHISQKPRSLFR